MHDPRYAELRDLLARTREGAGLTQVGLASRLRKPQSYVSKFERGERRLDVVELIDIARALDADPLELIAKLIRQIS